MVVVRFTREEYARFRKTYLKIRATAIPDLHRLLIEDYPTDPPNLDEWMRAAENERKTSLENLETVLEKYNPMPHGGNRGEVDRSPGGLYEETGGLIYDAYYECRHRLAWSITIAWSYSSSHDTMVQTLAILGEQAEYGPEDDVYVSFINSPFVDSPVPPYMPYVEHVMKTFGLNKTYAILYMCDIAVVDDRNRDPGDDDEGVAPGGDDDAQSVASALANNEGQSRNAASADTEHWNALSEVLDRNTGMTPDETWTRYVTSWHTASAARMARAAARKDHREWAFLEEAVVSTDDEGEEASAASSSEDESSSSSVASVDQDTDDDGTDDDDDDGDSFRGRRSSDSPASVRRVGVNDPSDGVTFGDTENDRRTAVVFSDTSDDDDDWDEVFAVTLSDSDAGDAASTDGAGPFGDATTSLMGPADAIGDPDSGAINPPDERVAALQRQYDEQTVVIADLVEALNETNQKLAAMRASKLDRASAAEADALDKSLTIDAEAAAKDALLNELAANAAETQKRLDAATLAHKNTEKELDIMSTFYFNELNSVQQERDAANARAGDLEKDIDAMRREIANREAVVRRLGLSSDASFDSQLTTPPESLNSSAFSMVSDGSAAEVATNVEQIRLLEQKIAIMTSRLETATNNRALLSDAELRAQVAERMAADARAALEFSELAHDRAVTTAVRNESVLSNRLAQMEEHHRDAVAHGVAVSEQLDRTDKALDVSNENASMLLGMLIASQNELDAAEKKAARALDAASNEAAAQLVAAETRHNALLASQLERGKVYHAEMSKLRDENTALMDRLIEYQRNVDDAWPGSARSSVEATPVLARKTRDRDSLIAAFGIGLGSVRGTPLKSFDTGDDAGDDDAGDAGDAPTATTTVTGDATMPLANVKDATAIAIAANSSGMAQLAGIMTVLADPNTPSRVVDEQLDAITTVSDAFNSLTDGTEDVERFRMSEVMTSAIVYRDWRRGMIESSATTSLAVGAVVVGDDDDDDEEVTAPQRSPLSSPPPSVDDMGMALDTTGIVVPSDHRVSGRLITLVDSTGDGMGDTAVVLPDGVDPTPGVRDAVDGAVNITDDEIAANINVMVTFFPTWTSSDATTLANDAAMKQASIYFSPLEDLIVRSVGGDEASKQLLERYSMQNTRLWREAERKLGKSIPVNELSGAAYRLLTVLYRAVVNGADKDESIGSGNVLRRSVLPRFNRYQDARKADRSLGLASLDTMISLLRRVLGEEAGETEV